MKKPSIKTKIYFYIYRLLRPDMVTRMRANGSSWTSINRMLRNLGQMQIARVEKVNGGDRLTFAHVPLEEKIKVDREVHFT